MCCYSNPKLTGFALLTILISTGLGACSPAVSRNAISEDLLLGTWKVDLRPTPDAEPYYKDFVVTSVQSGTFSGTFYGAPISDARINSDWGKLRIAFVTADDSGPYYHSATLEERRLEGLTNSAGRDFLAYWTAIKK